MKQTKNCSECSGTQIYKRLINTIAQGVNLLPLIKIPWAYPKMEIYVCVACSHYQMFVPEEYLEQIQEKYDQHI